MEKKNNAPKQSVFNKEVDSAINGFSLGVMFIGIGVFLLLRPDYFQEPVVSYIIGAAIGLLGVIGTGIEISKATKIKGMDTFSIGAVVFVGWLIQYIYINLLWTNIVFFPCFVFGAYGVLLGLFRVIYSIIYNAKQIPTDNNGQIKRLSIGKIISQIVLFLTQLCGLVVAILNVLKASGL